MQALEVGHNYVELDTGLAGSALQEGQIEAFSVYTTGESSPALVGDRGHAHYRSRGAQPQRRGNR
jgi:hypothetical protein